MEWEESAGSASATNFFEGKWAYLWQSLSSSLSSSSNENSKLSQKNCGLRIVLFITILLYRLRMLACNCIIMIIVFFYLSVGSSPLVLVAFGSGSNVLIPSLVSPTEN